jgi:hypothetical protein
MGEEICLEPKDIDGTPKKAERSVEHIGASRAEVLNEKKKMHGSINLAGGESTLTENPINVLDQPDGRHLPDTLRRYRFSVRSRKNYRRTRSTTSSAASGLVSRPQTIPKLRIS